MKTPALNSIPRSTRDSGLSGGAFASKGNTLAFVLIFMTILSFLMVPIINILTYSSITASNAKNALIALNLALQTIEELKAKPFDDVESMLPTDWKSFEGEWISGGGEKIDYPEYYKLFKKNVEVVKADGGSEKTIKKLKRVVVSIRWDELNDERRSIQHVIKLATCLTAEM